MPLPAGSENGSLWGVSCSEASACVAVGWYYLDGQHPLIAALSDGVWSEQNVAVPRQATQASLAGVACPTAEACTAVGTYRTQPEAPYGPLVETLASGRWHYGVPKRGSNVALNGVSCSGETCVAVGTRSPALMSSQAYRGVAYELSGTTWTKSLLPDAVRDNRTIQDSREYMDGVACDAASSCLAVGVDAYNKNAAAAVLTLANGAWSARKVFAPLT